jgi:hypothetical protein
MLKHGPGHGQGVHPGPVLFAEPRIKDFPYNIKIGLHNAPSKISRSASGSLKKKKKH